LHQIVDSRLKQRKKTFACFIDFTKAFDKIDRTLLFEKLQNMSIPFRFCKTLFRLFNETRIFIKSGEMLSAPFQSNVGTPQGDTIAPILFSLFLSDIEKKIPAIGPMLNGIRITMIMYADDICVLAESREDLQTLLDAIHLYCLENKLIVNVTKTKILVFHYGRCPSFSFYYENQNLEVVNSFDYLGFTFTVQLTFTPHLQKQIIKARSRIGQLFSSLPLMNLPLDTVLNTFEIYITPLFMYGLPLWHSNCSKASISALDSLFTKFLKRYLGLKPFANNATVHFITETMPFSKYLKLKLPNSTKGLIFPSCLSGLQINILKTPYDIDSYSPLSEIPSSFWLSKTFTALPSSFSHRKILISDIFDFNHSFLCQNSVFHPHPREDCLCNVCGEHAHPYHVRYCTLL